MCSRENGVSSDERAAAQIRLVYKHDLARWQFDVRLIIELNIGLRILVCKKLN